MSTPRRRAERRLIELPSEYKFARRARRLPVHCIVYAPAWAVPPWQAVCGSQRQVRRIALKSKALAWRVCEGCQHKAHLTPALLPVFPMMGWRRRDVTLR